MRVVTSLAMLVILGTCHNNHRDLSAAVRRGHAIQVKDWEDRVIRTLQDPTVIEQVASFMSAHAGSWSGEEIFGTLPPSRVRLEVVNEQWQLLVGIGVGDESLWSYPSKGVWRRLDRRERDRLLSIVGVAPESVEGLQSVGAAEQ